jgi:CheY-like chemotaxis protein
METKRKPVILIADDDDGARETARSVIEDLIGATAIVAKDGKEALRRVRGDRPDMVLLDMALPRIDGLEVARRVKANEETRAIPVIVVSGLSVAPERALEIGCEDYVAKPYDPFELARKVRAHLPGQAYERPFEPSRP